MIRALILAAGFGTRLGSLSDERPKPLLPVCNIPLIRYAVALLRGHGVTEVAVNLHHRGDLIRQELGEGFLYSEEESILGTGGGIARLGAWLSQGGRAPFFVLNGKIVTNLDLTALLRHHLDTEAVATMALREVADAAAWGVIEVDEAGRVTRLRQEGRPGAHQCMFTGVQVLSPRLLARLPTGPSDSITAGYLPALHAGERIEGVRYDGYWHEHSTPARYLQGNWNLLSGAVRLDHPPGALEPIAESAIVAPEAFLGRQVVLGARSRVGPRARLERVVVWPDSAVDEPLADAIVTPQGVVRLADGFETG